MPKFEINSLFLGGEIYKSPFISMQSPTLRLKKSHMLQCRTEKVYIRLWKTTFDNCCRCLCSGTNPTLP